MTGEVVRVLHDRRRVVATFPLPGRAAAALADMIGDGCHIVDIRESDGHERLVLVPPASPQLLGKLRSAFPDARMLVVELTDSDYGVRLGGPVTRLIDAGADGYVVARSLEQLAAGLRGSVASNAPSEEPVSLPAPSEESLLAVLDELLARRAAMRSAGEAR